MKLCFVIIQETYVEELLANIPLIFFMYYAKNFIIMFTDYIASWKEQGKTLFFFYFYLFIFD
jgi:hypothetical protein